MTKKSLYSIISILAIIVVLVGCIEIKPRDISESLNGETSSNESGQEPSNEVESSSDGETNDEQESEDDVKTFDEEKAEYLAEYLEEGVITVTMLIDNKEEYIGKTVTLKTPEIRTVNWYKYVIISDKYGHGDFRFPIPNGIDTSILPVHEVEECMTQGCLMYEDFYWTGTVLEDPESDYGISFILTNVQPVND